MENRPIQLSIGIPAVVAGLVVTFTQNHSAFFGLLIFGVWALITAVTVGTQLLVHRRSRFGPWRSLSWALTAAAGLTAVLVPATPSAFSIVSGLWALVFGVCQLVAHVTSNGLAARSGEGLFIAVISLAVGLLQVAMPANPVVNVGVLGAYWIVVGSWLIIGALSPRVLPVQGSSE